MLSGSSADHSDQDPKAGAAPSGIYSDLLLAAYDLALMHSASRWDLETREGRKASAAWLSHAFEQVLLASKPQVFWELGAYSAKFSRRMRSALPATTFHAFEANHYVHEKFQEAVIADGVNYHNKAIGPEDGTAVFKIQRSLGDREFPTDMGNNSLRTKKGDFVYEDSTVEMVALDNFAAQQGLAGKRCAVWVDAEGFAFEVLQGMPNTLKDASFVFIEVEDRQLWEGQKTALDIRRFLFSQGFIPILRDFEFKQQYNVLYAKLDTYEDPAVRMALSKVLQASGGP